MRQFIYFSSKARTSGAWKDLREAGRMDIVCNVILHTFFLSHHLRDDVCLHLVFYGPPTPPRHIELKLSKESSVSKKDIGGLIKRILFKYREGKKVEAFPGCFVEKKSFLDVVNELKNDGKKIYILDAKGKDIRKIKDNELKGAVFILGDQEGLPKKEIKRLKRDLGVVGVGNKTYFASQVITIINNELDRREE